MFSLPTLAKCADRTSMPKAHPISGSPESWLNNDALGVKNLFGISFDFFINWSLNPNIVTPIIWVKRLLLNAISYDYLIKNIELAFKDYIGEDNVKRLLSFAIQKGLTLQYIIFKDETNWTDQKSEIVIVTVSYSEINELTYNADKITMDKFRELIKLHSGGDIKVGAKGLIYGTSNLECYLSRTDSLYPGDVDLILIDAENLPIAIIEFKKHTLDTPIANQQLANYYPNPDGRKYNRLAILGEFLSSKEKKIPLFVLYYPTVQEQTRGVLELLQGSSGELSTKVASGFVLPIDNSPAEYARIVDKLSKAISYHSSL